MSALVVAGDVSGTCTLQAPSAAGSTVLTLPVIAADTLAGIAATQTLTNKTLVAPALGTPASGVLTNCTGVPASALPAGSVLQVVSTTKTDTVTATSTSFADITGMSVSITPSSASNKVLVFAKLGIGPQSGTNRAAVRLVRGSTAIFIGDAAGSRVQASSTAAAVNSDDIQDLVFVFLDSPATTLATTYKVQWQTTGAGTICLNRSFTDTDSNSYFRTASSITVQEIQG